MLTRWHAVRSESRDAGLTLMELIVSMVLMTICGTMTLYFFIGMNSATNTTVDANIATGQARSTLQAWTALLNLADSSSSAGASSNRFVEITPTSATFYSNADGNRATNNSARSAPMKVKLSLENSKLIERDYNATTGALAVTRNLATDVTRSGGSWLFTPYCAITSAGTQTGVGSCGSTASGSSALATVVRVDIAFTLTVDSTSQTFASSASISGSTS